MKYVLEQAQNGGWVATKQVADAAAPEIIAAASSLDAVCSSVSPAAPTLFNDRSIGEWAALIVSIVPTTNAMQRRVRMIKLLRTITGCDLRAAKEAIEDAL